MTELKTWDVCPDCGAENTIERNYDPVFNMVSERCSRCEHYVTGRVENKSWINESGWIA